MRPAEPSGVEAQGFVAADNSASTGYAATSGTAFGRVLDSLPPLTLAVGATAFAAAALFVLTDIQRTFEDTRTNLVAAARVLASDLGPLDVEDATSALLRRVMTYDPRMSAALYDLSGQTLVATDSLGTLVGAADLGALTARAEAGKIGTLALGLDEAAVTSALWMRGVAAFGLAFLATGATLTRRRPDRLHPTEKRRYGALVSPLPLGIAWWTAGGELLLANDQFLLSVQRSSAELIAETSYQQAIAGLAEGGYMQILADTEASRTIELHREDGTILLVDERPVPGGGFLTLVTDVTDRHKTDHLVSALQKEQRLLARRYHEEKLKAEAASRSKTSFLAHLSHDIRTPLNHIIGFAELMQHQTYGPLGDTRYLNYVETIKASGERLLQSFATILDLAQLESGQKVLRQDDIGVDALVIATTRRFSGQAGRAGLTLSVGVPCGAQLSGDRLCLERMLGNVVENAIRFTPQGGKVSVAAYAATDGVVIEIADSGIGMSEERLASLSQPFVFGDAAFTREHEGAGLGIAIARAIAELSGGRLAIDSSPALGTTVAISLPLKPANSGAQAA